MGSGDTNACNGCGGRDFSGGVAMSLDGVCTPLSSGEVWMEWEEKGESVIGSVDALGVILRMTMSKRHERYLIRVRTCGGIL